MLFECYLLLGFFSSITSKDYAFCNIFICVFFNVFHRADFVLLVPEQWSEADVQVKLFAVEGPYFHSDGLSCHFNGGTSKSGHRSDHSLKI